MKSSHITLLSLLLASFPAFARDIVPFDHSWSFFQGEAVGAEKPDFDSKGWQKLDVPHDWSIGGKFDEKAPTGKAGGWLPSGVAWYRKEFTLDAKGKRAWIEFDGVMANSEVWLNGYLLGKRPNGYVSFRYDLTPHLQEKNVIVVKADTSAQPASRWYSGAGIYRHVRVVVADPVHVAPWGVFVSTPSVNEKEATVKVETEIVNSTSETGIYRLVSIITSPDGNSSRRSTELAVEAGKSFKFVDEQKVSNPKLWDLETPSLYVLETTIFAGDKELDKVITPFGIRSAEFTTDRGFVLNGRSVKLKGVCIHHDGGAVGAAVPFSVWERRLKTLRGLGVNAIRTAHNPPAPEFLDLCDRMGFLVMDEFFDCWTKGKNKHDYHLYFKEWSHQDLRDGILRDRNHPSVIFYSVGNEIHDTPKPEIAIPILKGLVEVSHQADPTRPATQALFRPNVSKDFDNGLADLLDVIGVNYRDAELLKAWQDKPGRKIVGSEQKHDRETWLLCRDNPQHAGQFLWTGIDYLGESWGWPVTTYNSGLIDRAGFIEPRGYERQSWWSEKPMLKALRRIGQDDAAPVDPGYETVAWERRQVLFPDWTPANAKPHDENVEVYSNASEVELFLNEKSLGKKPVRKDYPLNWSVPFEAGTLKAVAYQDGKEVAADVLQTAGKPAKVVLKADRGKLTNSWNDAANVEVSVVDDKGVLVPTASNTIIFNVEGGGKILGVDNGNMVSHEEFQVNRRQAYQGQALVILRGTKDGDKVTFTAKSEGLEGAKLVFE
ncbi:MAG: glycoside hydrolase family 2 TIM barrel-domain containing protein [Luteolibacter sp.]